MAGCMQDVFPGMELPGEYIDVDPHALIADHDLVIDNDSGGKDSHVMTSYLAELAGDEHRHKVVVIHNDLGVTPGGEKIEWEGAMELARDRAAHYGFRFEVTQRPQGGLFDQIRDERGKFPGPGLGRWCTSDQKTSQAMKVVTRLAKEIKRERGEKIYGGTPVKVLYCLGLRSAESPGRAKKPVVFDDPAAHSGLRTVTRWLPIKGLTDREVWERIRQSGLPYHPAYDWGMTRLSCAMCVLASKDDLVRAARLRPALAREYLGLEEAIGHKFQAGRSMRQIVDAAGIGEAS